MKESGRQQRLHQSFSENGVVVIGVDLKKGPRRSGTCKQRYTRRDWREFGKRSGGKAALRYCKATVPGSVRRVFPRNGTQIKVPEKSPQNRRKQRGFCLTGGVW